MINKKIVAPTKLTKPPKQSTQIIKVQSQQDYLNAVKKTIGCTWDELAEMAGITPRAFKTYRMPITSKDYRPLNTLAKKAVDGVYKEYIVKMKSTDLYGDVKARLEAGESLFVNEKKGELVELVVNKGKIFLSR